MTTLIETYETASAALETAAQTREAAEQAWIADDAATEGDEAAPSRIAYVAAHGAHAAAVVTAEQAWASLVASIEIGHVDEEFVGDGGEESDLDAYVSVDVTIDGTAYPCGVAIGIRESEQGSARASGAMTSYGGGPDAWWVDASDWQSLPDLESPDGESLADVVLAALDRKAGRLWRETGALRDAACSAKDVSPRNT